MPNQNLFNLQNIGGQILDPDAVAAQANEIGKNKNVCCKYRYGKWNFYRVINKPDYHRVYWIGSTKKPELVIKTIKRFRSN